MSTPDDARLAPAAHVKAQPLEDRGVLVNLRTGRCFELNQAGFEIWRLITEGGSQASIAAALAARYALAPEVSDRDVRALVGLLVAEGLVEVTGAPNEMKMT